MNLHPTAAAAAAIAAAIMASAAVAGCGASPGGAAPSPSGSPSAAPASPGAGAGAGSVTPGGPASAGTAGSGSRTPGRCHTSMLSVHVVMGQPGAGQRYADLVLTNSSGSTCRVYGYPGMQLANGSGGHIPTAVKRVPGKEPLVTLAPGQQVSSLLHWTIVPGSGEGSPCEPTASSLIVTPPDETTPLHTSWPGGPVCQHGQIYVTAFQPGAHTT